MDKYIKLDQVNVSTLIILNTVYLGLLVFMSRGNINIFSQKEFLFVVSLDQSFFSGNDVFYGLRAIRVILKSLSFVPIGLLFLLIKNQKHFAFKGSSCVFFMGNLITLIVFQIILLDVITINIYNYILYLLAYTMTIFIGNYIINKWCLSNEMNL